MTDVMVRSEGVHKRFGPNEVLKGITLTVNRGEVMCLLGPSGSGKSTFLRCINHLEKINSGRLSVDGELVGYREANGKLYELHERDGRPQAPGDRDGLPAVQPVPAHDRARERHARRRCRCSSATRGEAAGARANCSSGSG